jgi:hypothetical protein
MPEEQLLSLALAESSSLEQERRVLLVPGLSEKQGCLRWYLSQFLHLQLLKQVIASMH